MLQTITELARELPPVYCPAHFELRASPSSWRNCRRNPSERLRRVRDRLPGVYGGAR